MPLLTKRLTPQQVASLVNYGVNPDLAQRLGMDPASEPAPAPANDTSSIGPLETLSRDSDESVGARAPMAGLTAANTGNLLGAPAQSQADQELASLTPSMDPFGGGKPAPAETPPPAPPPAPAPPKVYAARDANPNIIDANGNIIANPNYQPNAGAEGKPISDKPLPPVLGNTQGADNPGDTFAAKVSQGIKQAFSSDKPLFQNPLKEEPEPPKANPKEVDSGPAKPQSPDTRIVNAGAQAAAANANAISNWKKQVTAVWDGYQQKPIDQQIELIKKQGELDTKLADDLYQNSAAGAAAIDALNRKNEEERAKDLAAHQQKLADLEALNQKVMNEKLDPDRWWTSKSKAQQVGITIGSILGGLGGNRGQIDKMINQDLQLQEHDLNSKRQGIQEAKGILADQYRILGDKNLAREAARMNLIDSVTNQVALTAKKYGGQQAQLKAEALISDLQKQKADGYFKFWQYMNPDPRIPVGGMGVGGRKMDKEDVENLRRAEALQAGYNRANDFLKYFSSDPEGSLTGKVPGLNQIPGTAAMDHRLRVDDWNNEMTLALGPVVEAMNKGKPGAVELRTLVHELEITPGMSDQEKVRRVQRLQQLQKNAAAISNNYVGSLRSPGAQEPPSPVKPGAAPAPGKK